MAHRSRCFAGRCHRADHWTFGQRRVQRWTANAGGARLRQEGWRRRRATGKGYYAKGRVPGRKVTKKGRSAAEILVEDLPKELSSIYWPKNMYWRKPNERFVRPVRWLVAMLDDETIPLEFDGIRAGNTSRGHRILTAGAVTIPRAGSAYVESLRAAKVLGRAEREHQIRKALDAAPRGRLPAHAGARIKRCSIRW